MINQFRLLANICFFYFFLILSGCAIIVTPSGGDKDITPPKILKETPDNHSINFSEKRITILFDEYIKTKNLREELVISPPFDNFPENQIKGKKLIIEFKDSLKANTTYNFQFGESIVDNNEGNPLSDYQYVFSTGSYLDSLEIDGIVIDAYTLKPIGKIKVLIYKDSCDSCIYKTKPIYFSKTNKEGNFNIRNLKKGNYSIYVLEDKNNNYFLDQGERIGFIDSNIQVDTALISYELKLFEQQEKKIKLLDSEFQEYGKAALVFDKDVDSIKIEKLIENEQERIRYISITETKDTVYFWFKQEEADSAIFRYIVNDMDFDTIVIRGKIVKDTSKVEIKKRLKITANIDKTTKKPIIIRFSEPVLDYDTGRINIFEDSVLISKTPDVIFKDSSKTEARIAYEFVNGKEYSIIFFDSCFQSIKNRINDSIQFYFKTRPMSKLGLISIVVNNESKRSKIIIELIDSKGKVYRKKTITGSKEIEFDKLLPKQYMIRFIEDWNNNNKWDSGNFPERLLPERIHYYPGEIELKENWEIIDLSFTIPSL